MLISICADITWLVRTFVHVEVMDVGLKAPGPDALTEIVR